MTKGRERLKSGVLKYAVITHNGTGTELGAD